MIFALRERAASAGRHHRLAESSMSSLSNVGKWLKENRRWLVRGGGMVLLTLVAAVVLPSVWAGASDDSGVVEE